MYDFVSTAVLLKFIWTVATFLFFAAISSGIAHLNILRDDRITEEEKIDDDNDGCNDNYGNFDNDYDKNDLRNIQILWSLSKKLLF